MTGIAGRPAIVRAGCRHELIECEGGAAGQADRAEAPAD